MTLRKYHSTRDPHHHVYARVAEIGGYLWSDQLGRGEIYKAGDFLVFDDRIGNNARFLTPEQFKAIYREPTE